MQLNTTGPIRGRLITLDYTDEDAPALLLARPREAPSRPAPPPIAIETNHLIERVLIRERQKNRLQVPRMSMLMRFEEEHERRMRRVRRQFMMLLGVLTFAFLSGLAAGAFVHMPRSLAGTMRSLTGR